MTSKQRAYLKSLAMVIDPNFSGWKIKHDARTYQCNCRSVDSQRIN